MDMYFPNGANCLFENGALLECDGGMIVTRTENGEFLCEKHAADSKRAVVLYLPVNGQILMMKRQLDVSSPTGFQETTYVDDFGLPGGKVEENESDWEAIVRETYEETGLDITDPIPLFTDSSAADSGRIVTTFTARLISQPLQDLKAAHREGEPVWGPPDWLVLGQCTYRKYNQKLLETIGVQL